MLPATAMTPKTLQEDGSTATRSFITAFGDEISPNLDEQFEELKAQGVSGLDLRTAFGKNVSILTDEEVDQVSAIASSHGMPIHAIGSPVNKVKYSPEGAEQELQKLQRIGEIAKRVGTRRIRIFSPETDPQDTLARWEDVRAFMRPQVDYAESEDLVLMHENDGHFFGAFPGNCQRLLAEFAGPHFRAIYDPGNAMHVQSNTMTDWFPWLLPHLDTIHVKDAVRSDGHFVYAGQGDGDFVSLFRFLKEHGWNGPLTMEPHANMTGSGGQYLSGREQFGQAVACLRSVLRQAEFAV